MMKVFGRASWAAAVALAMTSASVAQQSADGPRIEIEGRLFNAMTGEVSANVLSSSESIPDVDDSNYMAEQMLVYVRVTPGNYTMGSSVHLTAIEDAVDKGEAPRVLMDRIVDVPTQGGPEQVVFVGFGPARVRCLPVTLKARFSDELNPQFTPVAQARVKFYCNFHRP